MIECAPAMAPLHGTKLEVEFPPDWDVVRSMRDFVGRLVTAMAGSEDVAARVSMVVSELAENAVKYSLAKGSKVRLSVEPSEDGIRCEAENEAPEEHIAVLVRTLRAVNEGDSLDAYARALVDAASSEDQCGSRVGLARIRHEGQMRLRCVVCDTRVRVIAEMRRAMA
jgi:hypothetical protein